AALVAAHAGKANESDVHAPPIFPLLPGCSRPTRKRSVLAGETDRHEQILEISIVIVGFEGILPGEQHRFRSVSERETNEVCFDRAQTIEQVARVECGFDVFPDEEGL